MTDGAGESGFAAFRERVFADKDLQHRLREIGDRDAFAAFAVQLGRETGFQFTLADVAQAMRLGHMTWLTSSTPFL